MAGSSRATWGTASDADGARLDAEFRLETNDEGGGLAPVGRDGRFARRSLRYSPDV